MASREQLEAWTDRWLEANQDAEKAGDWKPLADFYTEDATYGWNIGPKEDVMCIGKEEIRDVALGLEMEGLENWVYEYQKVVIDEKQNEIVGCWKQSANKSDGTRDEIYGIGGSWFRLVAVGDDDQNIYSFRGSSNAFMGRFRNKYAATLYTLPKNYRSCPEIVEFNNQVLAHLRNRLKSQQLMASRSRGGGSVDIVTYNGKYLEKPLVEYIAGKQLPGSKAVLTRTNIEALQVSSMLKTLGYKVKSVA